MTPIELQNMLDSIEWHNLSETELCKYSLVLTTFQSRINHAMHTLKHIRTHFPKKLEE